MFIFVVCPIIKYTDRVHGMVFTAHRISMLHELVTPFHVMQYLPIN